VVRSRKNTRLHGANVRALRQFGQIDIVFLGIF
jgi:hypothetical protein